MRYYDPEVGRFVSRDPVGLWGDAGNRGNAQNYCGNNPVSRTDPMGDKLVITHPRTTGPSTNADHSKRKAEVNYTKAALGKLLKTKKVDIGFNYVAEPYKDGNGVSKIKHRTEVEIKFKKGFDRSKLSKTDAMVIAALSDDKLTIELSYDHEAATKDTATTAEDGGGDASNGNVTIAVPDYWKRAAQPLDGQGDTTNRVKDTFEYTFAHEVFGHALMWHYGFECDYGAVSVENQFREADGGGLRRGSDHSPHKTAGPTPPADFRTAKDKETGKLLLDRAKVPQAVN